MESQANSKTASQAHYFNHENPSDISELIRVGYSQMDPFATLIDDIKGWEEEMNQDPLLKLLSESSYKYLNYDDSPAPHIETKKKKPKRRVLIRMEMEEELDEINVTVVPTPIVPIQEEKKVTPVEIEPEPIPLEKVKNVSIFDFETANATLSEITRTEEKQSLATIRRKLCTSAANKTLPISIGASSIVGLSGKKYHVNDRDRYINPTPITRAKTADARQVRKSLLPDISIQPDTKKVVFQENDSYLGLKKTPKKLSPFGFRCTRIVQQKPITFQPKPAVEWIDYVRSKQVSRSRQLVPNLSIAITATPIKPQKS